MRRCYECLLNAYCEHLQEHSNVSALEMLEISADNWTRTLAYSDLRSLTTKDALHKEAASSVNKMTANWFPNSLTAQPGTGVENKTEAWWKDTLLQS